MCTDAVSVLVSDANPMGCQLLANALRNSDQHFKVVACAVDSRTVVKAANEHQPSVALISLNLKDGPLSGLEALREMRRSKPGVSSVMLLEQRQHDHLVDSFRGGAKGVFFRTAPFEALCKCIEKVHEGEISSQLNLSAHTVKNYLFHIFDKLGVSSRVELVLHSSPQSGPAP